MNEAQRQWIAALRSGEYEQTEGAMKAVDGNGNLVGYCCLGVAAKVLEQDDNVFRFSYTNEDNVNRFGVLHEDGEIATGYLPQHLLDRLNISMDDCDALAQLNDEGTSFATIADHIEAVANSDLRGFWELAP